MRRLLSFIGRGMVALTLSFGTAVPMAVAPAQAAPLVVPAAPQASADVQTVGHRRHWRHHRGHWRGHRYHRRHRDRDAVIALGLGLGVLGALAARPRYHDDYYYAPRHRVYRGHGSAHIDWCYARYRSYRHWDNTFQPSHGPRRQCWSPYS